MKAICDKINMQRRKSMKKIKKFFSDFKTFISRGNVLDMAVGVIIAGAFSAIVTSLTNRIIQPLINLIVYACTGGNNFTLITVLNGEPYLLPDGSINGACIFIDWGNFIMAVLDFFIIAFVLFLVLKAFMKANSVFKQSVEAATNKELKKERREVRKLAKQQHRRFHEVWKEHEEEKARLKAEQEKIEAEEKAKQEEAERLAHPTTEMLLADILKELKAQNAEKKENE